MSIGEVWMMYGLTTDLLRTYYGLSAWFKKKVKAENMYRFSSFGCFQSVDYLWEELVIIALRTTFIRNNRCFPSAEQSKDMVNTRSIPGQYQVNTKSVYLTFYNLIINNEQIAPPIGVTSRCVENLKVDHMLCGIKRNDRINEWKNEQRRYAAHNGDGCHFQPSVVAHGYKPVGANAPFHFPRSFANQRQNLRNS